MRVFSLSIGLAFVVVFAVTAARPGAAEDDDQLLPWQENLELGPWKPVPASTLREVEALILRLADITHEHGGLTGSSAGGPYFEAVRPWRWGAEYEPDDADKAFVELVRRGPEAIPALLARLDDTTPTKMEVEHFGGFGSMWPSTELDVNPDDAEEVRRVRSAFEPPEGAADEGDSEDESEPTPRGLPETSVKKHVVTIGDVCFVILGQITNRAYQAVRGQPTACIVFNSPTHEPRLARAVRAAWEGTEVRAELARRLRVDLGSRDERHQGGAALRLAFFFPEASEEILARTLDLIGDPDRGQNIVAAAGLAAAAGVSGRPGLHAPLLRLALRTEDTAVLLATLRGLPDERSDALHGRLLAALDRAAADEGSEYEARDLLRLMEQRWPDRMEATVVHLLTTHGIWGARSVFMTYRDEPAPVAPAVWRPYLDMRDKATRWEGHPPGPLERLRVCDAAAMQIAAIREDLPFDASGDEAARDRQLDALRATLDAEAEAGGER